MSYNTVSTKVASVILQGSKQVKMNTSTIKNDIYEYDEIDYSQDTKKNKKSLEDFYKQQLEISKQYLIVFNDTLREVENQKKALENKYMDTMMVNNHQEMIGLNTETGYFYQTPEEYEMQLIREIDPLSCNDANGNYNPKLYEKKVKEIKTYILNNYTPLFEKKFKETMNMSYWDYKLKLEELNDDILYLKSSKYSLEQQCKEYPYLAIASTDDFLLFKEKELKNPTLVNENSLTIDGITGQYMGKFNAVALANTVKSGKAYSYSSTEILKKIRYDLLTEEDKIMYCYLYERRGSKEANEYIKAIEDRLNRVEGEIEATKFIKSITDVNGNIDINAFNTLKTSKKGIIDGIENFGEGISNLLTKEGMISTNQYAQMYILDALNKKYFLSGTYKLSVSAGNMAPAIATSVLLSSVLSPAAANLTASSLMGVSAGGNAKNQALVNGNTLALSYVYGTCIGLSETTLGYFMGKIPGLSKTSGFSLKNILLEGAEEFSQEWVEIGAKTVLLEENIDWSKVSAESLESFILGVLMAGIMNGTPEVLNYYLNEVNNSQQLGIVSSDSRFVMEIIDKVFKKKNVESTKYAKNIDGNYILDTKKCSKELRGILEYQMADGTIPYNLGVQLEQLYFDNDNVVGVHRAGMYPGEKIVNDGLILSGDSGQGVGSTHIDLENNITFYDSKSLVGYSNFLHGLKEAAVYKTYNNEGDAILVCIPKSQINNISNLVEYRSGIPYLKKQYILGTIHSSGGNLSTK